MHTSKFFLALFLSINNYALGANLELIVPTEAAKPVNEGAFCVGYGPWMSSTNYTQLNPSYARWGGNTSTRFNFIEGNVWNAGRDYFFANVSVGTKQLWKEWITFNNYHHIKTMFTVPTLGFIAKDSSTRGKIGAKPELTSVQYTDAELITWITQLKKELGNIERIYPLDNEPFLWHETHADIVSKPITPKEFASKWIKTAKLIRKADAEAILAGPSLWGYKDLNNLPEFLEVVMPQTDEHGKPLLNIVTAALYPQNNYLLKSLDDITGIKNQLTQEPGDKAKLRFESTKAFDIATYTDPSWINIPINYINRLNDIIEKAAKISNLQKGNYPKIGISEYNWGAPYTKSGGATLANLLFKFLQTDIHHACYFTWPPPDSQAGFVFAAIKNTLVNEQKNIKIIAQKSQQTPQLYYTQENKNYVMLVSVEKTTIKNPKQVKVCSRLNAQGKWENNCKLNALEAYELYKLELN